MNKQKVEQKKHKEAFRAYYDMGDDRTIERLSQEFENGKYSVSSLQKWSSWFNWKDKTRELNEQTHIEFTAETRRLVEKRKVKLIRDMMDLIEIAKRKFQYQDKVTAKDIEVLVNLMLKLNGEETDKQKIIQEIQLTEDDKQSIIGLSQSIIQNIAKTAEADEEDEEDGD